MLYKISPKGVKRGRINNFHNVRKIGIPYFTFHSTSNLLSLEKSIPLMTDETQNQDFTEDEKKLFEEMLSESEKDLSEYGVQRRLFLKQMLAAGGGMLALQMLGTDTLFANTPGELSTLGAPPDTSLENGLKVSLKVNGAEKSLQVDSRMTLLDALRERLGLTGSKKGCDHGQCGACTVMMDGKRVLSCLTLAASCEARSVVTIEGLARNGKLHPMQAAFVKHDGFQCGYCTPGQICSAVALLEEAKKGDVSFVTDDVRKASQPLQLSDDEIRERMSGNICRCGAYPNIVAAIREVHTGKAVAQNWQFAGSNESNGS